MPVGALSAAGGRPSATREPGRHAGRRLCVSIVAWAALSGVWMAAGSPPQPPPDIPALQETPVTQYRALRRMHASNERFNHEGWLDCWTELDASGFRYEIVSERGSEYIREKILKTMLRREQEMVAGGSVRRAEISDLNYEFAAATGAAEGAPGERTVLLKPKRKDMLLVDGHMVINENGTELLRVEGRLAKNPSFWTSLVNIVREFARLDGVRVVVATETVARLKFAGTSRMDVQYRYETINGRRVSLDARQAAPEPPTR